MSRPGERRGWSRPLEGSGLILDRVTVTGAGGFIGGHLMARLLGRSVSLRGVLGPGDPAPFSPVRETEWVRVDLRQPDGLEDLLADTDTVVHLAGPSSVADSFADPRSFFEIHVLGTQAVVGAALRVGVRRFVYVSSAEVYGRAGAEFVSESAPLAPRSPYAAAKAGGEMVVHAASHSVNGEVGLSHPTPTFVVMRPFLVYGPHMGKGSVVRSVLQQTQWEERIELMDPTPVRDFCFVGDVVDALVTACTGEFDERLSVFNVGSGEGVSIRGLARAALAMVGRNAEIEVAPRSDRPRRADLHRLVADTECARRHLGWSVQVPLQQGLEATLRGDPGLRGDDHGG